MSMEIGPVPMDYGAQEFSHRKIGIRQIDTGAKAVAENLESAMPGNRGSGEKIAPDIRTTAQELEHISLAFNRRLKFIVDYDSKEVIVKVIDTETDKVIRVLPPKELQGLHERIRETLGFLFDQRV